MALRTAAGMVIVLAALPDLLPLMTSSLAGNLWSFQQNLNPSPGPSQLVVRGLRRKRWWTLQMQLN